MKRAVRSIPDRIQRAKDYAAAYCELGKAKPVGVRFGVTEQWVRWVLQDGHKKGWCRYSPNDRSCRAVVALPDALKSAVSWHDLSEKVGLKKWRSRLLAERLNLDIKEIAARLTANRTAMFIDRMLENAERLGVRHSLNTTVLQADNKARASLAAVQRRTGWSINEIRNHVGASL